MLTGNILLLCKRGWDEAFTKWQTDLSSNFFLTAKEMIGLFAKEMKVENKVSVLPIWLLKLEGLFMLRLVYPHKILDYKREGSNSL